MKSRISWGSPESTTTPTTSIPRGWFFLQKSAYSGISLMHGPHHVAQKSSTTTLPLSDSRLTRPPARSGRSKAGAGRTSAFGGGALQAAAASATARTSLDRPIPSLFRERREQAIRGPAVPASAQPGQEGKGLREVLGEERETVRDQQDAHADEEDARSDLDRAHRAPEAPEGPEEAVDREGGSEEGQAQAEGVRGEEQH